jgi:photosystem II stability/assembly factor-like uncharacterized protein
MVGRLAVYPVLLLLAAGWLPRAAAEEPADPPPAGPQLADAQLADVTFVDAEHGWAVGDRGVIWRTLDGGHHWALQPSGVDCRLAAVDFIDARHGWAAGGFVKPYTRGTTGVVLETRDGGEHWQLDRKGLLPALGDIKFFDSERGWAVGQSSALFPVGVFTTDDGGRSWSSLPADEGQSWLAGDFVDSASGIVVGRTSGLGSVVKRAIESRPAEFGLRSLHRVRLAGRDAAWVVGDGGLIRHTADRGKTWQPPAGELPSQAEPHFDFQALAVCGDHCWVAGTPGTQVMHTADGGRTWQAAGTGQSLPIRALTFVDERRGWAVGDLGLILNTSDGGQTWQRQHAGGGRAALLGFYGRPSDVPLELFARLSSEEGYLGVVEILNRQDLEARRGEDLDNPAWVHDAVVRVGGSAAGVAWQFPVREPGLRSASRQLVEGWNGAAEGRGLDEFDAYLMRQIRTWRPSIVFVPGNAAKTDPLSQLVAQAVLQAVERAGDPQQRSEQISQAGLEPWKVEKVFTALPPGEVGLVTLSTAQLSPRSGRSQAEIAAMARGIIVSDYQPPPTSLGFRLLVDRLPQDRGTHDFFSGISLASGSEARRTLLPVSEASLDRLRRTGQARRNLQAILAQANRPDAEAGRWLAEVAQFTQSLEEASAAELLFQLAQRYYRSGRWDLAAETFELVATRYPKHPLASAALVWLVQYHASSEAGWRTTRTEQINARQVVAVDAGKTDPRRAQPIAVAPPQIVQSGGLIGDRLGAGNRPAEAAKFAKLLEQSEAGMFAEPEVRFPLAIAQTRLGLARQAERYYLAMRRGRFSDTWSACAAGEAWLVSRERAAPKPIAPCPRAASKPRLDGQLDDPLWQQLTPLELHSASRDDAWSTVAMLAYDDEYLYWAASCRRAPGGSTAPAGKGRPRDANLQGHDRIELCLDLDRDWTTFYRLSVDERGFTRDECWHDVNWNPQWFVAAGQTDDAWTIEAAIPLAELTRDFPTAGQTWALGISRAVPTVGLQSWSKPAAVEPFGPGFGYLMFE